MSQLHNSHILGPSRQAKPTIWHPTKAVTAVAIRWMSSAERPVGGWTMWSEVVEFSSLLTLSVGHLAE